MSNTQAGLGPLARDLAIALLALIGSGVVLGAAFLAYTAGNQPAGGQYLHPKKIAGNQLRAVIGSAQPVGEGIKVTALAPLGDTHNAIISVRTTFRAANYRFLHYRWEGLQPGVQLHLIWRTANRPRALNTTLLNRNPGSTSTFDLALDPNWVGTITEIGVHLSGDLQGRSPLLPWLELQPYNWRSHVANLWSNWTAFRGWTQRSINFLYGTNDARMLSPSVVAILWAVFALVPLVALARIRGRHHSLRYALVLFIPWLAMDILWQAELSSQLDDTRYRFGDKSTHEKHLASDDGRIYRYAKRLREQVLPDHDPRIFLAHKAQNQNFERLKTQFYLLPANVYNFGRFPPAGSARPGDYVLALGQVPGLKYSADHQRLRHQSRSIAAELIDSDPLGQLYRVLRDPAKAAGRRTPQVEERER